MSKTTNRVLQSYRVFDDDQDDTESSPTFTHDSSGGGNGLGFANELLQSSDNGSGDHPLNDMAQKDVHQLKVPFALQLKYSNFKQKEKRRQAQTLRANLVTGVAKKKQSQPAKDEPSMGVAAFLETQNNEANKDKGAKTQLGDASDFNGTFGIIKSMSSGAHGPAPVQSQTALHYSLRDVKEPPPSHFRSAHTISLYDGALYMFGGRTTQSGMGSYVGGIHVFVPARSAWVEVPAKGHQPLKRGDHSAIVYKDQLIVFGGRKHMLFYDDMHSFDFTTGRWSAVHFETRCGPGHIFGHQAILHKERMYVIGGVHRDQTDHLIHCFDLKYNYWIKIEGPRNINPNGIFSCCAAVHAQKDELVVLGLVSGGPSVPAPEDQATVLGALSNSSSIVAIPPSSTREASTGASARKRASSIFARDRASTISSALFSDADSTEMEIYSEFLNTLGVGGTMFGGQNKPSDAVIVLHAMNLATQQWKEIRSAPAPDSPIPFTASLIKEVLLPNTRVAESAALPRREQWCFLVMLPPPPSQDGSGRHGSAGEDPWQTAHALRSPSTPGLQPTQSPSATSLLPIGGSRGALLTPKSTGGTSSMSRNRSPSQSKRNHSFGGPPPNPGLTSLTSNPFTEGSVGGDTEKEASQPPEVPAMLTYHFAEKRWSLALLSPNAPSTDTAIKKLRLKQAVPFERRYALCAAGAKTDYVVICGGGDPAEHIHTRAFPSSKGLSETILYNYTNTYGGRGHSPSQSHSRPTSRGSLSHGIGGADFGSSGSIQGNNPMILTSGSGGSQQQLGLSNHTDSRGQLTGGRKRSDSIGSRHVSKRRASRIKKGSIMSQRSAGSGGSGQPDSILEETLNSQGTAGEAPFLIPHHLLNSTTQSQIVQHGCPLVELHGQKAREWETRHYRNMCNWIVNERRNMEKAAAKERRAKKHHHDQVKPSKGGGGAGAANFTGGIAKQQQANDKRFAKVREVEYAAGTKNAMKRDKETELNNVKMGRLMFDAPMLEFAREELFDNPRLLVQLRWGMLRQYVLSGQASAQASAKEKYRSAKAAAIQDLNVDGSVNMKGVKAMLQASSQNNAPVTVGSTSNLVYMPMVTHQKDNSADAVNLKNATANSGGGSGGGGGGGGGGLNGSKKPRNTTNQKWGALINALAPVNARKNKAVPVHPVPYETGNSSPHYTPRPPVVPQGLGVAGGGAATARPPPKKR